MRLASWLDRVLYRHPFEGASARRYATAERPAFGPLDHRLLEAMPQLASAQRLLDVGFGPGTFVAAAAARHAHLKVIAIDPSRDFARTHAGIGVVRAAGESLPIASETIDVAICLSSIRHVRDRSATLAELRRVVRRGGTLVIVELDPAASATRIAAHAEGLGRAPADVRGSQIVPGSTILRRAFGPLVVRTAPTSDAIAELARGAGWEVRTLRDDPVQPVYMMELA